jgi:hypothetical protein
MVPNQSVNPYLKNTSNGTFTKQTYGGTIVGLSSPTTIITKALLVKDINASEPNIYTFPKLLSGNRTYNTAKILSAGTFAYNAAVNKTWVMTRLTTTLAGVSKTFLQFIANVGSAPSIAYYVRDNYTNATSLIRTTQFSRTGYSTTGAGYGGKIKARTTWITTPTATAGADFGSAASQPSRAYPGELYILNNFVDYKPSTSSNKYYYRPITGK